MTNNRTQLIIIAALLAAISFVWEIKHGHAAEFHDAAGRVTGSSRTDSNGVTTFYGPSNKITGRARTDSNGVTTFYDPAGRVTGKASR
jgi:hypothetical protein